MTQSQFVPTTPRKRPTYSDWLWLSSRIEQQKWLGVMRNHNRYRGLILWLVERSAPRKLFLPLLLLHRNANAAEF